MTNPIPKPGVVRIKEIAEEALQWSAMIPSDHAEDCAWVNVGIDCGCGRDKAVANLQLHAFNGGNYARLAQAYLDSIKRNEEGERIDVNGPIGQEVIRLNARIRELEKERRTLYRRVDMPSDEPVLFVGVYVLKWGRVDEPTVGFVEASHNTEGGK